MADEQVAQPESVIKGMWNGNSTRWWRGIVLTIFFFLASWVFYKVEAMDSTYATKDEVQHGLERIEDKLDGIERYLRNGK